MRYAAIRRLASILIAVSALMVGAGPALADPPAGTTPRVSDAVGTGADTSQFLLDQLSSDFNAAHKTASTKLYSFDAVGGGNIVTKQGCAANPRPDGSSPGIAILSATVPVGSHLCVDYARSTRGPEFIDPIVGPGGLLWVPLAGDAVTWADRNAANGGTNAPKNLTTAQLTGIYNCTLTNWAQVGGKNAPIDPFLPQAGSGTRTFFLTALGLTVPGGCVSDDSNTLQENEGVNPVLNSPNAIFIYSVGDYIAQAYHSPAPPNCLPAKGQNKFGCDETGVLQLNTINGSNPATPWPLTPSSKNVTINKNFIVAFQDALYDVFLYDTASADHIPGADAGSRDAINLEQFFAAANAAHPGWACSNATAKTDIKSYGFLVIPDCGVPLGACTATAVPGPGSCGPFKVGQYVNYDYRGPNGATIELLNSAGAVVGTAVVNSGNSGTWSLQALTPPQTAGQFSCEIANPATTGPGSLYCEGG